MGELTYSRNKAKWFVLRLSRLTDANLGNKNKFISTYFDGFLRRLVNKRACYEKIGARFKYY